MGTPGRFLLSLAAFGCAPPADDPAPVVLIVLDALHAGHVGHLGYERETTPVLDGLAREGLSFALAVAPAPYTLASLPSLHTGRLPDRHGLVQKDRRLPEVEVTLAERLVAAGYRTFGATASTNGSSIYGLDQGFEHFVEVYRGAGPPGVRSGVVDGEARHIPRADEFVPLLENFIARTPAGTPGFYYLHILEPHAPYQPPREFRERFVRDPDYEGPFADGATEVLVGSLHGRVEVGPKDVERTIDLYDANLAWVDSVLGRLLDVLRTAGIHDQAWIVVTSDHGEAFWQHGRWGHNDRLHEEMVHVPLVVKTPVGIEIGRKGLGGPASDELVSLLDLVPSLIGWLGLEEASDLDGIPLPTSAVSTGGVPPRRLLLRSHQRVPHLALRTPTEKLIVTVDEGVDGTRTWGGELYDLSVDSAERHDLAGEMSAEQERLAQKLREWTLELVDRAPGGDVIELSPEDAAFLRELGYAD